MRTTFQLLLWAAIPAVLLGRSTGPPVMRTGAPVDGGLNCTACHRGMAVNEGPGKVTINASGYHPGRRQTIRVIVEDPAALRWGFQLTARLASDETKPAGAFTANAGTLVRCPPDNRFVPAGDMNGCGGAPEFASHSAAATAPGTSGRREFEVEWTAPANNVGDVVFYAAGNAANNDGTNAGDHIYTAMRRVEAEPCEDSGTPSVSGVGDAAAGKALISSNTIISLYGSSFADSSDKYGARKTDLVEGKVPTQLACVAVEVDGKRAPVFYVQNNQINAQAPFLLGGGPVEVRVIRDPGGRNEKRSAPFRIDIQQYSPAFFTFDGRALAARNASSNYSIVANPSVVSSGVPAKPGDVVVLYGTGFGFTEPVYQPGEFPWDLAPLRDPYTIRIGGTTLARENILYAGLSAEAPGFYQFNLRLPDSVPDGDVPVVLSVGGLETQSGAYLPVKR